MRFKTFFTEASAFRYKWRYNDSDGSYSAYSNDGLMRIWCYQGAGARVTLSRSAEWIGEIMRDPSIPVNPHDATKFYGRTLKEVKLEGEGHLGQHDGLF